MRPFEGKQLELDALVVFVCNLKVSDHANSLQPHIYSIYDNNSFSKDCSGWFFLLKFLG